MDGIFEFDERQYAHRNSDSELDDDGGETQFQNATVKDPTLSDKKSSQNEDSGIDVESFASKFTLHNDDSSSSEQVENTSTQQQQQQHIQLALQLDRLRKLQTPSPAVSVHDDDFRTAQLKNAALCSARETNEVMERIDTAACETLDVSALGALNTDGFAQGCRDLNNNDKDRISEETEQGSYFPLLGDTTPLSIPARPVKVGPADFQLCKVIGRGAYGKVFLVRKRTGVDMNKLYAMKVLRKATLTVRKKDTEHTRAERTILERLQHPFIVELYYAFQTDQKLYLILGYAQGGELYTYLEKETMMLENTVIFYVAELVLAIEHLHSLGIIYRDLKPENILLDRDGHIVLTDFGLSKVGLGDDGKTNTVCGTVEYMAPEILAGTPYDMSCDWWSMGTLLFDMLTGSPPFSGGNRKKTVDKILNSKISTRIQSVKFLSPNARDLLAKLLRRNPAVRVQSAQELKTHRFFKSVDWHKALSKQWRDPPFVPQFTTSASSASNATEAEEDTSHFSAVFTNQPVVDTPLASVADLSMKDEAISGAEREMFKGFSFVNDKFAIL